jgi:DNA-binding transcriptional LysR family regulator
MADLSVRMDEPGPEDPALVAVDENVPNGLWRPKWPLPFIQGGAVTGFPRLRARESGAGQGTASPPYTARAMDTRWLEDFVALAETRNFSRAAVSRHVTQPAFSRRIQALEAWTGIALVDRSVYPTRLTPAGEAFHGQALEMLAALQATRNLLRAHQGAGQDTIEFAVPHTLAFTFLPQWLHELKPRFGALKARVHATNVHDAVIRLTEGHCDLLIAYHHPSQPLQLSAERHEWLALGSETLAPFSAPGPGGGPLHRLDPAGGARPAPPSVPFLAYAPGAYMARLVEGLVKTASAALPLVAVYETDIAEGLKAMALEGHGCAFLPASSVRREVASGRLVRAAPPGRFELSMDVRIVRERPLAARAAKPLATSLWEHVAAGTPPEPHDPGP